jgi:uncharacterized membrane protein YhaH (DUF805 family)
MWKNLVNKIKKFNENLNWATKQGFIKAFDFKSRATRMEYWIFSFVIFFVERFIERFLDPYFFPKNEWEPLSLAFAVIFLIPSLSVTIRRLHDTNRSAWWLLLIPTLIGIPFLIYFYFVKGSNEKNKYGPPRKNV